MPVIRVSDAAFDGLAKLARWNGDTTPSKALDRIIRDELARHDLVPSDEVIAEDQIPASVGFAVHQFHEVPAVTHTKVLSAQINGEQFRETTWWGVFVAVLRVVGDRVKSPKKVVQATRLNASHSRLAEAGYKWIEDLRVSVQGPSAERAAKEAHRLAREFDIPLSVDFEWRRKAGALHPGEQGRLIT